MKLLHNCQGFLQVRLSGYSPERFLNMCSAGGIEIWDLQYCQGEYEYYTTAKGFKQCKPLVRKAKVRLKILKKLGLPFFLHRNRTRKLFFGGLVSFFLLLYITSLFVWDINFEGNYFYTDDTLTKYLSSQEIHHGMRKSGISCEELEAGIRNRFPEITWVSARVSGTRLLVKIKENQVLSSIPVKEETSADIVASLPGTITKMVVRSGVAQVSSGMEVEKGQLLVSGQIPILNDSEELVRTHYVQADADIYARTGHKYEKKMPLLRKVQAKTGKEKTGFFLKIFDYSGVFLMPSRKESTWTYTMEEQQLKLFSNFYLPIYYGTIHGQEFVSYERFYTKQEKNQLAQTTLEQFLKNLMEKGVQIIENDVRILDNKFGFSIVVEAVTEESIVQHQTITEPEETLETDERSGDNH